MRNGLSKPRAGWSNARVQKLFDSSIGPGNRTIFGSASPGSTVDNGVTSKQPLGPVVTSGYRFRISVAAICGIIAAIIVVVMSVIVAVFVWRRKKEAAGREFESGQYAYGGYGPPTASELKLQVDRQSGNAAAVQEWIGLYGNLPQSPSQAHGVDRTSSLMSSPATEKGKGPMLYN